TRRAGPGRRHRRARQLLRARGPLAAGDPAGAAHRGIDGGADRAQGRLRRADSLGADGADREQGGRSGAGRPPGPGSPGREAMMSMVTTDAWVLYPGGGSAPLSLVREEFSFPDISEEEVLAEPLYGCWEGNMAHALERRPIDVCRERGEERVVV